MDDDKHAEMMLDTISSSSKQPGDDFHVIGYAQCCRVWPIAYVGPNTNMSRCGICGTKPKILPMDKWPTAKNLLAQSASEDT